MKQKNQKIGTFSRTKDRSGEVGEQKHGEELKNSSKNNNTFLAAVTSSKDVHAMHKTSKEQISHINFQKEQPIRPAFFEKECKEDAHSARKIENNEKSSPLFSKQTADKDRGHSSTSTTKKDKAMKRANITDSGSKPERKCSGILAGLSNLPIVNFFTSFAKKVTDSDGIEQESTLESKTESLSMNFKNSANGSNMHSALHISPYFIPGMKPGDILFTIAAVVAHSRRVKVDCRIPWAYSEETRELRAALGMNALPSTLCGANEALAYEEESFLYTPIPETVTSGGLCGYFQSGNYFAEIEPIIRHLFTPLTAVDKTPGTVGIHITIGNDPFKYSKYRLSTALFLQKAAARLSKDIREVVVFSDKPNEAMAMLIEMPEFSKYSFRADTHKGCEQLYHMTAMQELVISNSALSWWAAWLGKPRKVISPRCWFMHKAEQPPVFEDSPWIVL